MKKVKLVQIALNPQFIVEEDGIPASIIGSERPIIVFAAQWPTFSLDVQKICADLEKQLNQDTPSET